MIKEYVYNYSGGVMRSWAWCPYNRYDRDEAKKELGDETVRSAIATIAIAETENVLSRRSRQS